MSPCFYLHFLPMPPALTMPSLPVDVPLHLLSPHFLSMPPPPCTYHPLTSWPCRTAHIIQLLPGDVLPALIMPSLPVNGPLHLPFPQLLAMSHYSYHQITPWRCPPPPPPCTDHPLNSWPCPTALIIKSLHGDAPPPPPCTYHPLTSCRCPLALTMPSLPDDVPLH